MNRNIVLGVIGLALAVLVIGCIWQTNVQKSDVSQEKYEKELFAMDTVMKFTAYGEHAEQAVEAAAQEVTRLDQMLSTGKSDSEVSILNQNGTEAVSSEVLELFKRSEEVYQKTGGLFDITIYPLMELWGFTTQNYHVATKREIQDLLPYVDAAKIKQNENEISLEEGQKIDFGAIAKGFTSARLMEIYEEYGVTSGMVYLGGNVQTLGTKPDGSKWNIGIQNPSKSQGEVLLALGVQNQAVITSGGYERYFEENGETYIHILDPRTGAPVRNDLSSVTIVSPDGTLADALSTSLFIMGREQAIEFWRTYAEEFQMILVTTDGKMYITEGLISDVKCDQDYEIIMRATK